MRRLQKSTADGYHLKGLACAEDRCDTGDNDPPTGNGAAGFFVCYGGAMRRYHFKDLSSLWMHLYCNEVMMLRMSSADTARHVITPAGHLLEAVRVQLMRIVNDNEPVTVADLDWPRRELEAVAADLADAQPLQDGPSREDRPAEP